MDHIQTLTEHKKIRITGYLNNDPIWIYFVVWIKVLRKKSTDLYWNTACCLLQLGWSIGRSHTYNS